MKLLDIIWKEVSLIKSQKITLLLIILYPFLVIGLLGSAFTGIDTTKLTQTNLGITVDSSIDQNFTKRIVESNTLKLTEYTDINSMIMDIKSKKIIAGIWAHRPSKESSILVEIYYDNSSILSARFFVQIAESLVQKLAADTAQNQIISLWEKLSKLGLSIGEEKNKVEGFKARLVSAEATLNKLESDINNLDFSDIESNLSTQQNNVNQFNQKNEEFKKQLASFKTSFSALKTELNVLNNDFKTIKPELDALPDQINTAYSTLDSTVTTLSALRDQIPDEGVKQQLNTQISSIQSIQQKLFSWKQTITKLSIISTQLTNSESQLNKSVREADSLFSRLDSESASVTTALSSSTNAISNANQKLAVFKSSINEVKAMISDSRIAKNDISNQLNESETILTSFESDLEQFSKINPITITKPVLFFEKKLFDVSPFGILVANSLSVVLILTCMLLTSMLILLEQAQRVSQRLLLSPTSKITLLVGKIIGQLMIALLEAMVILTVAFAKIPLPTPIGEITHLGFGFSTNISYPELLIALTIISLAFIAIGILVSFFTKNQSTAILLSLLIIVPMLFLSGIILPLEFMDPVMKLVSTYLPLTIANNILVGLLVRGDSLLTLLPELLILLGFALTIIIVSLLKKKP